MKAFKTILSVLVLISLISGCAPQAVPTINAADVQSTAVSVAATIVAQTQAAIPTVTPLPPTETPTAIPSPTETPLVSPTSEALLLASPTTAPASGSVDPCSNRVLAASPKGKITKIRIVNSTKSPVTVSLYLNETDSHGECGYRAYNLSKNSDTVITDLVYGCYNLWAWSTDPKNPFNVSSPTACINNSDKWTFEVTTSTIKFTGP